VEVLSKTTRKIDHTLKKLAYQNLPSLQEYVLIEQDFVDIQVCRRNNHWQSEHFFLGDTVSLSAVELSLTVETIYARVDNEEMRSYFAEQSAENYG
jgi:Uma2 family endonuclease